MKNLFRSVLIPPFLIKNKLYYVYEIGNIYIYIYRNIQMYKYSRKTKMFIIIYTVHVNVDFICKVLKVQVLTYCTCSILFLLDSTLHPCYKTIENLNSNFFFIFITFKYFIHHIAIAIWKNQSINKWNECEKIIKKRKHKSQFFQNNTQGTLYTVFVYCNLCPYNLLPSTYTNQMYFA